MLYVSLPNTMTSIWGVALHTSINLFFSINIGMCNGIDPYTLLCMKLASP